MAEFNKKYSDLSLSEKGLEGRISNSHITVIELHEISDKGYDKWECECDCGNQIIIDGRNLRRPRPQKSCGCLLPKGHKYHKVPGSSAFGQRLKRRSHESR
jgi:hypothetical protein